MAASGPMADFARLPPRQKTLVFVVIGLLIGLLYWKFIYKDLDEQLETAQSEHDTKVDRGRKLAADIPKFEELRARMTKLHDLIEKNQTALPSEPELSAFFETLQRKVAESGAEIRKWSNGNGEPVESFVRVPVEVEITGTFLQIKRFFASLVQHDVRLSRTGDDQASAEPERIVSIENLALTNPTVSNREVILNAKFTAVTYRQEDKSATPDKAAPGAPGTPAGAAKPPAPRPAAPPPPASPASTPPPLPSAATPAGAKVRVEGSLEKGDARNGRAGGVDEAKAPAAGSARLKGGL